MTTAESNNKGLGHDGDAVRVLNFAGGAFDTVMQLGAVHALLVIQGRPPDAVVGISAGAVQAAACAEIMQAGEAVDLDQDENVIKSCYRRRQEERVKALRHFIDAVERAPEEILDSALPDAYEIESRDPLQPLRTARFVKNERDERERMLQVRSGLIKLYNDLLRVQLSVGIVARVVRRFLGYKAASEIPGFWSRLGVRTLEAFRIWLLIGSQLHRLVTVAPKLVRPLITYRALGHVTSAGRLIFRFSALRRLRQFGSDAFSMYVLATSWVLISTVPAIALVFSRDSLHTGWYLAAFFVLPYLFPLLMAVVQAVNKHDAVTRLDAIRDGIKAFFQFFLTLIIWAILIYLVFMILLPSFREEMLGPINHYSNCGWEGVFKAAVDAFVGTGSILIFALGACFTLGIILLAVIRFKIASAHSVRAAGQKLGFIDWYIQSLLRTYGLSRSLLHHYPIENFLAKHFDREYYGDHDMDHAIEESLRSAVLKPARETEPTACQSQSRKSVGNYHNGADRNPPIAVGLGVADVGSGKVEIVPEDVPVVCGLRAAMALVPLFSPVAIGKKVYVDALNITSVPMPALLKLLHRYGIHDGAKAVYAYRVAPVPFSRKNFKWEGQPSTVVNLVDIALRALRLQQFRDAGFEQRLTHRYSELIKGGMDIVDSDLINSCMDIVGDEKKKAYFKIWVVPIELDIETGLNRRILIADRTQRREEILKTIAEGCHAAMQAMLPVTLKELSNNNPSARISCPDVFDIYQQNYSNTELGKSVIERLPGSDEREDCPPGLKEICKYCTKELKWNQQEVSLPDWPHELLGNSGPTSYFKNDNTNNNNDLDSKNSIIKALGNYWATPSAADIAARSSDATASALNTSDTREALRRPTVSLLFSGGVFRGVFQIGVVNALHELGVKPDIVAGSSVGSIMAAIAANILVTKHGATEKSAEKYESALKLARLAASFLAIDRLILTDQFADFVREFTLRAATTNFSLYKADRLFRKYDQPSMTNFDHGAREVVAGIERLFYINFYQLNVLVRAIRQRNHKRIVRCVKDFAQQWLDRMSVGEEMLGAQPLEALIDHFVGENAWGSKKVAATDQACLKGCFHEFLANGVIFLSTTTELHEGRLLTLGSPFGGYGNISKMDLAQALLASSAFPSVFRARSMSDLFPIASRSEQFIDGGVMDNLPIDAVVKLLEEVSDKALNTPLILRRPYYGTTDTQVPHLVFAASLQPHVGPIEKLSHLHVVESNWMQLRKRVKKLSYNHKLKLYEQASAEIGTLYKHWFKQTPTDKDSPVLDLEVASLIPNWLCGTFAFHPMLGYRRERQAQSIAHGCAMTLLKLRNYKDTCLKAWGIDPHELPHAKNLEEAETTTVYPAAIKAGKCWLRPEIDCPFSKQSLYRLNLKVTDCGRKLEGNTITELAKIHIACCDPKTHRP